LVYAETSVPGIGLVFTNQKMMNIYVLLWFVELTVGVSLYEFTSPMVHLHASNFTKNVINSDTAWAIEFYATWCPHCQRFASEYADLAEKTKDWKSIVRVGSIPCNDGGNNDICQEFNIWGYPTVKFFPPGASKRMTGDMYDGEKDVGAAQPMRRALVDYIYSLQPYPEEWLQLGPYSTLPQILAKQEEYDNLFVFMQDETNTKQDYMGKELALDFSNSSSLICRVKNMDLDWGNMTYDNPSLHHVSPDTGLLTELAGNLSDRAGMRNAIHHFLSDDEDCNATEEDAGDPNHSNTTTDTYDWESKALSTNISVYMDDLESGLYYSLWNEIGSHDFIDGQPFMAMKECIRGMAKYFPGRPPVKNYLFKLYNWTESLGHGVEGSTFQRQMELFQSPEAFIPPRIKWVGCAGSSPRYRGYPCALWTLFHALSVNAYIRNLADSIYQPKDVMRLMQTYARFFFGCRHCARNAVQETERMEEVVNKPADMVIYLWAVHNTANYRIMNHPDQAPEDPHHPKFMFPSFQQCPACRNHSDVSADHAMYKDPRMWNLPEVLKYLVNLFHPGNVISEGDLPQYDPAWTEMAIEHLKNDVEEALNRLDTHAAEQGEAVSETDIDEGPSEEDFSGIHECPEYGNYAGQVKVKILQATAVPRPAGLTTLTCNFRFPRGRMAYFSWLIPEIEAHLYAYDVGRQGMCHTQHDEPVAGYETLVTQIIQTIQEDWGRSEITINANMAMIFNFRCMVVLDSYEMCLHQARLDFQDPPITIEINSYDDSSWRGMNQIACKVEHTLGKPEVGLVYAGESLQSIFIIDENSTAIKPRGKSVSMLVAGDVNIIDAGATQCRVRDYRGTYSNTYYKPSMLVEVFSNAVSQDPPTVQSPQSAQINWKVLVNSEFLDGVYISYWEMRQGERHGNITVVDINSSDNSSPVPSSAVTTHILEGLTPGSTYAVDIQPYKGDIIGTDSDNTVTFQTTDEGISGRRRRRSASVRSACKVICGKLKTGSTVLSLASIHRHCRCY